MINEECIPFTGREMEASWLSTMGKSHKEIADELNISIRTVDAHIRNSKAKVGVTKSTELSFYIFTKVVIPQLFKEVILKAVAYVLLACSALQAIDAYQGESKIRLLRSQKVSKTEIRLKANRRRNDNNSVT